jgi:hypothetical protein
MARKIKEPSHVGRDQKGKHPMRIRSIKPEFWESESLGRVSREARLLFIGLFSCCDDVGRGRASSRLLASRIFPSDDDAFQKMPIWLNELSKEGCVRLYSVDGENYLDLPKWLKHQKIDKPSPSKLPEYQPQFASIREDSRKIALELELDIGNGTSLLHPTDAIVVAQPQKEDPIEKEFLENWKSIYQSIPTQTRHNKPAGLKAWKRRRKILSKEEILQWWFDVIVATAKSPEAIPGFDVERQWGDYDEIKEKITASEPVVDDAAERLRQKMREQMEANA